MKIGIPVYGGDVRTSINTAYIEYVKLSELEPILITEFNDVALMVQLCDGILLPGGIDIEPTWYGEENEASDACDPDKDDFERLVMHTAIKQHKPVFGICRGFQLMVREFLHEFKEQLLDLNFIQHISGHSLAASRNAKRSTPTHAIAIVPQKLYGLPQEVHKGATKIFVNSMHHQALVAAENSLNVHINADNRISCIAGSSIGIPKEWKNHIVVEAADIIFHGSKLRGVDRKSVV